MGRRCDNSFLSAILDLFSTLDLFARTSSQEFFIAFVALILTVLYRLDLSASIEVRLLKLIFLERDNT